MEFEQQSSESKRERTVPRGAVVLVTLATVGVAGMFVGSDAVAAVPIAGGFTSLFTLGAVWLGRARSQERWQRAWEAYALQDGPEVSSRGARHGVV
jgi:hypothetical protein